MQALHPCPPDKPPPGEATVRIREMDIDDFAQVFHRPGALEAAHTPDAQVAFAEVAAAAGIYAALCLKACGLDGEASHGETGTQP